MPSERHLCPVCSMPKPAGLKHCSLRCEEADPLPQPEEAQDAVIRGDVVIDEAHEHDTLELLAKLATLSAAIDKHFPAPVEGASE